MCMCIHMLFVGNRHPVTCVRARVRPRWRQSLRPASLDDPVLAPADVTSAGGRARQLTSSSWHVPQHRALEAFLYVSGPSVITRYNFQLVARMIKTQFVRRQPFLGGDKYSPADTYVLTEVGESRRESHPDTNCFRWEMACTGKSAHGKAAPNCQRVCGGFGMCLLSCAHGAKKHHTCTVRLIVSATLEDVFQGRFLVRIKGAARE